MTAHRKVTPHRDKNLISHTDASDVKQKCAHESVIPNILMRTAPHTTKHAKAKTLDFGC